MAQHEPLRDQPVALLNQHEHELAARTNRRTVARRLRDDLLGELPDEALDDLITCAAATDVEHRRALAGCVSGSDRQLAQIDELLWPPPGGAGPRVLRRPLLSQLAERDSDDPASWDAVFANLRATRAIVADERGELSYALAGGDLPYVVTELTRALERLSGEEWQELLLAVTAAPRRRRPSPPGTAQPSPDEQYRDALRRPAREWPSLELARLVTGLWIVNDPMTDARRRGLHEQIAHDYEWLAGHSPQESVQCYRQNAHRHRRWAVLWPWR